MVFYVTWVAVGLLLHKLGLSGGWSAFGGFVAGVVANSLDDAGHLDSSYRLVGKILGWLFWPVNQVLRALGQGISGGVEKLQRHPTVGLALVVVAAVGLATWASKATSATLFALERPWGTERFVESTSTIWGMTTDTAMYLVERTFTPYAPPEATVIRHRTGAICGDGWRSNSTGRGTCSWHGGVNHWLYREEVIPPPPSQPPPPPPEGYLECSNQSGGRLVPACSSEQFDN